MPPPQRCLACLATLPNSDDNLQAIQHQRLHIIESQWTNSHMMWGPRSCIERDSAWWHHCPNYLPDVVYHMSNAELNDVASTTTTLKFFVISVGSWCPSCHLCTLILMSPLGTLLLRLLLWNLFQEMSYASFFWEHPTGHFWSLM